MVKLTKSNANELNLLFDAMLLYKKETRTAYVNIFLVAKTIDVLSTRSEKYIRSIMYLARHLQKDIPQLFTGDTLIFLHESSIKDFLAEGGFLTIYKSKEIERKKDNFRFWSIFIITIITLSITIYQILLSDKASPLKNQTEKQRDQGQTPSNLDSTKFQKTNTASKNDKLKK
jgi:hypothetical protein